MAKQWSEPEIAAFKDSRKRGVLTVESMKTIAIYYKAERAKGRDQKTGGIDRRDLLTFCRNAGGELDRALAHSQQKSSRRGEWLAQAEQPSNLIALPEPTPDEKAAAQAFMERVRERHG